MGVQTFFIPHFRDIIKKCFISIFFIRKKIMSFFFICSMYRYHCSPCYLWCHMLCHVKHSFTSYHFRNLIKPTTQYIKVGWLGEWVYWLQQLPTILGMSVSPQCNTQSGLVGWILAATASYHFRDVSKPTMQYSKWVGWVSLLDATDKHKDSCWELRQWNRYFRMSYCTYKNMSDSD